MDENKTPLFCAVCGTRLTPNATVTGYDVFTGYPLQSESLHCTNPTVEVSGYGLTKKTSKTYHPSWYQSGGEWVQG